MQAISYDQLENSFIFSAMYRFCIAAMFRHVSALSANSKEIPIYYNSMEEISCHIVVGFFDLICCGLCCSALLIKDCILHGHFNIPIFVATLLQLF